MKLFPSLSIAALCAVAFAGCTSTTQKISFVPEENATQSDVTVSVDGKVIGQAPVSVVINRPASQTSNVVVFSKPGFKSETMTIDSWEDSDGLCSYFEEYYVPALLPEEKPAAKAEPAADESAPEPAPEPAEEPAPAPVAEPAAEEPAPEPAEDVGEEAPIAPTPVPTAEEPAPEPAADEPAPEPAADEPELSPTRTLKDIQDEIDALGKQRQNGSISEAEFKKSCEALRQEIIQRYGK